jgi:hypothetical protein
MLFSSRNRKVVHRIWAVVSILVILGMLGVSVAVLFM